MPSLRSAAAPRTLPMREDESCSTSSAQVEGQSCGQAVRTQRQEADRYRARLKEAQDALPVLDVSNAATIDVEAKDEEGFIGTAAEGSLKVTIG